MADAVLRWRCARVVGEALEVGCDDGESAILLAREGHRVVAVEARHATVEAARQRLAGQAQAIRERVDFQLAEAGELPFEDHSFDTVLLGDALSRQVSRERPIAEARRTLRPGGRLIVTVPYGGAAWGAGAEAPLEALLEKLGEFSVKEIAVVDDRLCLLADRARQRSRGALWRQALGVVERRLAAREEAYGALSASVTGLEARRGSAERALADARGDVERLEAALAATTHQRDRREEEARLAADGVAASDERLRQLQQRHERERTEAERELATVRSRLEAREEQLEGARLGIASRDAELLKARRRAEQLRRSLAELRAGRAYRLMRVLWGLRRPFKRARRGRGKVGAAAEEDSKPAAKPPPRVVGSKRPARQPGARLRVASILDEMSEACFGPECDLVPLTFASWSEQLDEAHPDLLLVESAWNGNGGEWQYRIAKYPRRDLVGLPALRNLLAACRERGIPTAFWNKEDPVHFDRFAEAASLFDHVFTTDARCVERYRAMPGERTVTPLPFAAQPRIHNPAAVVPERGDSPCFAGAWYRDRHPDRRAALEALLDAARPYGLVIYDRSYGGKDGAFGFPERFGPHVLGKLPYERVLDVYKSHKVFLNANSVVDSPTMCSRRVFELAACDTAMLSTPALALRELLGAGVVEEAGEKEAAAAALERLLADGEERRRRTRAARRRVFAEHTYAERLATIAETVGLDSTSLRRAPFAWPAAEAGGGCRWQLHVQHGLALAEPSLADLAAAASFADAEVIGAHPSRNGDAPLEHRYVDELDPRALLLSRELVGTRGRPAGSPQQLQAQLRQWSDEGVRLYAADADLLVDRDPVPVAAGPR